MQAALPMVADRLAVAQSLPLWLEKETDYANEKYGSRNPQLQALDGSIHDSSNIAHLEVSNYYSRFWNDFMDAEGNEYVLTRASQALGKMVNANRALLRVIFEVGLQIPRQAADEKTFRTLEGVLPAINSAYTPVAPERRDMHLNGVIRPALETIGDDIAAGQFAGAADKAVGFLLAQAELWIDFSCQSGVIATPGVNSSDPAGELGLWMA